MKKDNIKKELHNVATKLFSLRHFEEANSLIKALGLIERMESALDRLEHRRSCNAKQVKVLTKRLRAAQKGLKKLMGHKPNKAIKITKPGSYNLKPDTLYDIHITYDRYLPIKGYGAVMFDNIAKEKK